MTPDDRERVLNALRARLPAASWRAGVSVRGRYIAFTNGTASPPVVMTAEWRVSSKHRRSLKVSCGARIIERRGFYFGRGWHERLVDDAVAAIAEVSRG